MSKRHGKSRQTNPHRARSKNNPGGRRNDPKTDWSEYNKAGAPRAKGTSGGCAG